MNKLYVSSLESKADLLANNISYLQNHEANGCLSYEESILLKDTTSNYLKVLKQIEVKWARKARMQWIISGDNNTKFFIMKTQINRHRSGIHSTEDSYGIVLSDPASISFESVSFFRKLWNSQCDADLDSIP